ncbi:unnamed protein product [Cylindrotheca closterium]|uniref:Uncharacterized protein n=1 Tax=Cylindrotheca closterium TaxID=2856 RepID=A0AAD2FFC9_9STRA|nr:unnamed protein product [Cylindrotheca closterium]
MKSGNYQQFGMNNLNNLKGFASKMREQARDAAKKLPSLDEMAAKDDYIHKEEFNVKGEKQEEEQQRNGERRIKKEENSSDTPTPWSLIDKRIFQNEASETPSIPSKPQSDEASFKSSLTEEEDIPLIVNDSPIETAPKKTRPLMMSVVTDAMTARPASPETCEVDDESSVASDSSSDSDSWNDEGDEEDDPILSMIRKSKVEDGAAQKTKKPKKSNSKTSKKQLAKEEKPKMHRFLADMADAENQMETNSQSNEEQTSISSISLSLPATPRELGSWMKNMASNQVNKILKRPDLSQSSTTTTSSAPPLASRWKSKLAAVIPMQEEYHSQDSADLLGDDELRQLASFKQSNSGGKLSTMMAAMYEYRQFAFILFTLILAGVVYFFKFSELEDGVT